MAKLPKEIKLTLHAQQRLEERNNTDNHYNTKNLMRSNCRWYGKDDLIPQSQLYIHCLYVCRKSNQMGYLTDGNIEVVYNRNTGIAITVLEVKDKFKPIDQYIKPSTLKQIEIKKENRKMKKFEREIGYCPDCGRNDVTIMVKGIYEGLCDKCKTRKQNAKARGKKYVPYKDLPQNEKDKVNVRQQGQAKRHADTIEDINIEIPAPSMPIIETPVVPEIPTAPKIAQINVDVLSDQCGFINTLRGCGCEIPENTLKDVLDVLVSTDKLKEIFMTIAESDSQQAILDLEQALNVVERKLQHDWEYNGFQEADDKKFKSFLTWRRILKGAIFFWKKLYQTNALIEMQRAWNAYTQDPNDKILLAGDRINSVQKRFQITTDSISTIFNTRRPFTRVFYAVSEEDAYKQFVQWMSDRQLHEDKNKTTIVELKSEGEDGRKEKSII